jgi:S-adenosylmethionine uptake transporter
MGGLVDRKIVGVLYGCAGYGMYSLHYATMKWLATDYSLGQLTFSRSVVMLVIALAVVRRGTVAAALASPYKYATAFRAVLILLTVVCFYSAVNLMSLAEVTTLYSVTPIIVVLLSIFLLGERVRGFQWLAIAIGVLGTVIAANPGADFHFVPAALAVGSGFFWALTVVLTRKSGGRESVAVQMVNTSVVCVALSLVFMTWKTPASLTDWCLILFLGIQIYLAQYFFIQACRFAPASLIGPLEYTSLVWSCALGFLIFAEVPTIPVLIGAVLVTVSGIAVAFGTGAEAEAAADALLVGTEPVATEVAAK